MARSEAEADSPQSLAKPDYLLGWLWASKQEASDCLNNQKGEKKA